MMSETTPTSLCAAAACSAEKQGCKGGGNGKERVSPSSEGAGSAGQQRGVPPQARWQATRGGDPGSRVNRGSHLGGVAKGDVCASKGTVGRALQIRHGASCHKRAAQGVS
jgi:hypothetical protein